MKSNETKSERKERLLLSATMNTQIVQDKKVYTRKKKHKSRYNIVQE